jgi:uncharacterized membrane protein YfcA
MGGYGSFLLLSAAVFLGAFVSGFAGFAFSAVAGAILLHTLLPIEAVPLMMACSVGVQATNLWALRRDSNGSKVLCWCSGECWACRLLSGCCKTPMPGHSGRCSVSWS